MLYAVLLLESAYNRNMTMLSKGYKGRGSGRNVAASGIEALSARAASGSRKSMPKMKTTQTATREIYAKRDKEARIANKYVKKAATKPAPAKKAATKSPAPKKTAAPKPKSEAKLKSEYRGTGSDTSNLPPVDLTGRQFNGKA